jgi:hypothetical protein
MGYPLVASLSETVTSDQQTHPPLTEAVVFARYLLPFTVLYRAGALQTRGE